ncbi:hypothetical protein [Mariniflexile sp. AS56]|uniref:hypothetical protein n=1 Tax=Mariniflexile sp. AS56 TaxID=3063957 RepID=UPI0026F2A779|nr:hypothetical protein [Mariniflexile sp. AS56]MDO7174259.1 hypothetical protein [Mariniflexile sp. AS56]
MKKLKIKIPSLLTVEIVTLLASVCLIFYTNSKLNYNNGNPIKNANNNISFLEKTEYDKEVTDYLSIQHNCGEIMKVSMFLRPSFETDNKGYIDTDLKIAPFEQKEYPCKQIAINFPSELEEISYLIGNTYYPLENNERPDWLTEKDIYIDSINAPKFQGELSFKWKNSIVDVGKFEFGVVIPIAFLQNEFEEISTSHMTYLIQIQTPSPYKLISYNYPLDDAPKIHPQGEINTFRIGPMFSAEPLILRYENTNTIQEKSSNSIFWSTLFGLWIGLAVQAFFAIIKELLNKKKTMPNNV